MTTSINKQRQGHDDILENVTGATSGPNSDGSVDAGLLVIPAAATQAGIPSGFTVAGAGAANVLGVTARKTVSLAGQAARSTDDGDGFPFVNPDSLNELTAVWKQCVVPVTYTAVAVAYGVKLKSAANGAVAAFVEGTDDPGLLVGECRVPGGMGSGGGVGLAYIY